MAGRSAYYGRVILFISVCVAVKVVLDGWSLKVGLTELDDLTALRDYSEEASYERTVDLPMPLKRFLESKMPPFLKTFKDPCWYEDEDNATTLNCLPYFYQIGISKCGTTSLCSLITQHPHVRTVRKEPRWVSLNQFKSQLESELKPISEYVKSFEKAIADIADGFQPMVFGDCSPDTMWFNGYHRLLPEPRDSVTISEPIFTNADYIHHLNPATKLIAIVRNPIDRLFSDYMFFREPYKRNHSVGSFDNYARDLVADHQKCLKYNTLRACVYKSYPSSISFREVLSGRHRPGFYHVFLKDFLRVFPRKQILVIRMEDYSHDVLHTMRKVFSFLELDPLSDATIVNIEKGMKKNSRHRHKMELGEMWNTTRALLYDFYKPHNDELGKLLGPEFNYGYN